MKYEQPKYDIKLLEAKDVITLSIVSGVEITEVFKEIAEVSASANDVLG